jgi:dTDP-glucose 4,6-dehydratase
MTILVTGGAGFIGSNFVLDWLAGGGEPVVNVDKLTYAGNLANLAGVGADPRHRFVQADIADQAAVERLLAEHRPRAVVHFAAESHVDRSIHGPGEFVQTNVVGTFRLLEAARGHWQSLAPGEKEAFRFLHVSTDEVYGSLGTEGSFSESTAYAPNSPYAASKAGADHLVRAYHHTYGLPTLVTNCSNNYGPYQFPEKLIPLMVLNAAEARPLPIYGDGGNVRDWLYVEDHCDGLLRVLEAGRPGEHYNLGGNNERTNVEIVDRICTTMDALLPAAKNPAMRQAGIRSYFDLKHYVDDRPGHDRRYAIDARKVQGELGWSPRHDFDTALGRTVGWYLAHRNWCEQVSGAYNRERLGQAPTESSRR